MILDVAPFTLRWDEVDPARHPFDPEAAAQVTRSLAAARRVPRRPDVPLADPEMSAWSHGEGSRWADAMSYALAEHYGRWVIGWRWAHDEGDFDGGPVGHWCCPRDSITTPEETVERVVAALCEWRAWLESLAGRFSAYPLDPAAVEGQRILWERAARNLILQVVDRTGCGSGWQGHCRLVLSWFLERWGIATETAKDMVDHAISGRFHSWTGPDSVLVDDVAEKLALSVRPDQDARPADPAPDHLQRWLSLRESVAWEAAAEGDVEGRVVPLRDGAAEDIRVFDAAIDPARAEGLLAALRLVRADAARGARLDFELLAGWQQSVLAARERPRFRRTAAFAKGGRERYGLSPGTRTRLDACLAESASDVGRLSLSARAARAYLDVCFFHPFDDGNARAALLTAVFVLARADATLYDVRLLRRVTFQADAPEDPLILTRYIAGLLSETRRAAPTP